MSNTTRLFSDLALISLKKYEDPRTANWPLVENFFNPLAICACYVFSVKILGPKLMRDRKPFELKNLLICYNFFQVVFSSWMFYEFCRGGWLTGEYNYRCQPIDYTNKPSTNRMVNVVWYYYVSKFTELPETIFFIMRKKYDQVNILHVYHHGIMPLSGWLAVKYYPSGHGTFAGLLNTFVHIIMYSYYFLSAFGPGIQKYLWWKKYITTLQMIQFVVILAHTFQLLFTDCNFPKIFIWYMGLLSISFYVLFRNFYKSAYKSKSKKIH